MSRAVLLCAFAVACDRRPVCGTVTNKRVSEVPSPPIVVPVGKMPVYIQTVPHTRRAVVVSLDGRFVVAPECRPGEVEVDEATFRKIQIGQRWPLAERP